MEYAKLDHKKGSYQIKDIPRRLCSRSSPTQDRDWFKKKTNSVLIHFMLNSINNYLLLKCSCREIMSIQAISSSLENKGMYAPNLPFLEKALFC